MLILALTFSIIHFSSHEIDQDLTGFFCPFCISYVLNNYKPNYLALIIMGLHDKTPLEMKSKFSSVNILCLCFFYR